MTFLTTQAMYV